MLTSPENRKITTRLWDQNYDLLFVIDDEISEDQLRLPFDSDVAKWLRSVQLPVVHATVDVHAKISTYVPTRRMYLLSSWEVRRNGPCPECDHCRESVLETRWTEEALTSYSWRPPTSVTIDAGGHAPEPTDQ